MDPDRQRQIRQLSTLWGLCRRPVMYTATGTLPEALAFASGLLTSEAFGYDDQQGLSRHFRDGDERFWVRVALEVLQDAPDWQERLWAAFERWGDEDLGVPRGTVPPEIPTFGYSAPRPVGERPMGESDTPNRPSQG